MFTKRNRKKSDAKQARDTFRSEAFRERQGERTMRIFGMRNDLLFAFVNVPQNATDDEIVALHEKHCAGGNRFEAFSQIITQGTLATCFAVEESVEIPVETTLELLLLEDYTAVFPTDASPVSIISETNLIQRKEHLTLTEHHSGNLQLPGIYIEPSYNAPPFKTPLHRLSRRQRRKRNELLEQMREFDTQMSGHGVNSGKCVMPISARSVTITSRRYGRRFKFYSQDESYIINFTKDTEYLDELDHFSYLFSYRYDHRIIPILHELDCEAKYRFFDACPTAIREYTRIYGKFSCKMKHQSFIANGKRYRKCYINLLEDLRSLTIGTFLDRKKSRYFIRNYYETAVP